MVQGYITEFKLGIHRIQLNPVPLGHVSMEVGYDGQGRMRGE